MAPSDTRAEAGAGDLARAGLGHGGGTLAELWLAVYGRLAARAAHEVNNALNGAAMNLEVVRLRAKPGNDAGALAPFVAGAAAEQEAVEQLVAALVGLARAPRVSAPGTDGSGTDGSGTDVREVCAQAVALVAPVVRHAGVTLRAELGDRPAPTAAAAHAVRLAICVALDGGSAVTTSRVEIGAAGGDQLGSVRCTLLVGNETIVDVAPAPAEWTSEVVAVLADAGVRVDQGTDHVRLLFPPL